jgi:lipoate-protein ligase B
VQSGVAFSIDWRENKNFKRLTAVAMIGYLLDQPMLPFRQAHELQLSVVAARNGGRLQHEVIMLLEHAPVFTLGRRGGLDNLLISPADLIARSIEMVPIERGGDITYHGPGQLVVYVLMDIRSRKIGVTDFVGSLETAMVRTAAHWGVTARGDEQNRGAWIEKRKLGSIGITVRRGVTFHGLALNVHTDLEPFQWINPCGLKRCRITTLEREAGVCIVMDTVRRQMAGHLSDLFDMELTRIDLDELKALL